MRVLMKALRSWVVSRASENVKNFLADMQAAGAPCDFVEAQLGDNEDCHAAVAHIEQKHGRLYELVNNAGANDGVGLENGSPERFVESLQQNLVHYYAMAPLRATDAEG